MVSTVKLATLLITPLAVLACEGECIIGITKEYIKLYTSVVLDVLQNMACVSADKVDAQCIPPANRRQDSISYFTPVIHAYYDVSYDGLRSAIFPSYFHGKCLYSNGTVPNGCPNPDCPVVCGTPGSLVHFFPVLTQIAYNEVSGQLTRIISPRNKAFQQVEKMVLTDAQTTRQRALSGVPGSVTLEARTMAATRKRFRAIMKDFPVVFLTACGGSNLSQCSWETYMKKFILKYP